MVPKPPLPMTSKVGFVGRNGAGKSTLLRVLLGEEELDRGEVSRHLGCDWVICDSMIHLHQANRTRILQRDSGQPAWKCGEVAGQFELKGAYLDGPVSKLSGGWQTRVKLAALLLHERIYSCWMNRRTFSIYARKYCWSTFYAISRRMFDCLARSRIFSRDL